MHPSSYSSMLLPGICLWVTLVGVVSTSSKGLPPALDISLLDSLEPACHSDLQAFRQALQENEHWALAMLDSSVKWPSGLMSQTAVQYGDFDLCLSITTPVPAQYCLPDISPVDSNASWTGVKWAVCVPASCSPKTLKESLQKLAGPELRVDLIPVTCTSKATTTRDFDLWDTMFCVVSAGILLLVVTATIFESFCGSDWDGNSAPRSVVECLSARRAFVRLCTADLPVPDINLRPLYGLHSLGFFFIVLGHRLCSLLMLVCMTNYRDIEYMYENPWLAMWTGHVDLFVDMFFFMSAFLMSLVYSLELQNHFVSPITVYFYRYFRLVPAFAMVVGVYATVLRHFATGPLWNFVMYQEQATCRNYWWADLLFIGNIVAFDQLCMVQTWFLSCEFQLFLFGVLLVLLLHRSRNIGLFVLAIVFLASTLAAFLGTYLFERPAFMVFDKTVNPRLTDLFTSVYSQSYFRGTSYLPGLLAGYLVSRIKCKPFSQSTTRSMQVFSVMGLLLIWWSGALFSDPSLNRSVLVRSLYAATFHTIFGCFLGLLVISSIMGKRTWLSEILSWPGFVPLSKLSYGVFLIHLMLQLSWAASLRAPVHFNGFQLVGWTIADSATSLILSLVLFLTVESPAKYLVRYFTTSKDKRHHEVISTS